MQVSKAFPNLENELSKLGFKYRITEFNSEDNYYFSPTGKLPLLLVITRIPGGLANVDMYETRNHIQRYVYGKDGVNPVHVAYHLQCKLQELGYL